MSTPRSPKLIREAERQGWRVKRISCGGWLLRSPDGVSQVTIHPTPSDPRTEQNTLALLRRGGFR